MKLKTENGFTLIELAIVLIIVGVLIIPLLQMYQNYLLRKEIILTKENVETAVSGVSLVVNRLPCPSDRSLGPQDANFGLEQCNVATIPLCSTAGLQGICRVQSAFDRDGNGTNDDVIIGGIPLTYYTSYSAGVPVVASLRNVPYMNGSNYIDAWDSKLSYAVTANVMIPGRATDVVQNDFKAGVISALDENGNPTAGINNNALFVIFSHGKDRRGAFSRLGLAFDNCPATARGENCDEDTTFMQGISIYEGADPFDDISKFFIIPEGELWRSTGVLDPGTGTTLPHIRNSNSNNVGINITTPPTTKLEVGGTIRADSVRSNEICGPTTADECFVPTLFNAIPTVGATVGTTGICNNGQIVTRLADEQLTCGFASFNSGPAALPAGTSRVCPAGSYVSAVYTNGCITCNNGVKICS